MAIAAWVPGLIWQARHGWPQLAMSEQISREQDYIGGAYSFFPLLLLMAGIFAGMVLLVIGLAIVTLLR